MDALVFSLSFAALAFAVFLALKGFDRRLALAFGALFALYLGLDDLVTGLPSEVGALAFVDGDWNWSGKVYSLVLSIVVVIALAMRPESIGLTFKQRNLKASLVALVLFVAWGTTLGLLFDPEAPSAETLAFQATMPGIVEEIAYRGIAPALLLGLVRGKGPVEGVPWTVVWITAIVFGVWHGLGYSNGEFSFDAMSALFPFVGSVAGGWLRFHSGSLVFPILAHGAANVAFHLSVLA